MAAVMNSYSPSISLGNNKRPRDDRLEATNKRVKSSLIAEKNTDAWANDTAYSFAVLDTNTLINCLDKVFNLKFYNNMQVVVPIIGMFNIPTIWFLW
eukprot:Phypoly_transcript_21376.p1 GENE.Phypoly_transcript_21376~~Phypoly_transcript_21376.p1  ORF type:complete len:107 (+),score=2.64 Phypoly_transcript_21376:32-322(+)